MKFNEDEFKQKFAFLAASNEAKATQLITNMFVRYFEYLAIENGGDSNNEIKIDGYDYRDITIHPKKITGR